MKKALFVMCLASLGIIGCSSKEASMPDKVAPMPSKDALQGDKAGGEAGGVMKK